LRVLLVIDSLKRGGKEKQFYELVRKLKERPDFEIFILVRRRIVERSELFDLGIKVYFPESVSKYRFICFLNQVIKEVKPDIINSWEGFVTTNCIILGLINRIRIINFDIQYAHRIPMLSCLFIHERLNQVFAYRNIANSYAGLESFRLKPNYKTRVIYNGFDFVRFTQMKAGGLREKLGLGPANLIGMTANFTVPKDYKTLIEAGTAIVYGDRKFFFIFIGEGPEREAMSRLVPHELREHFIFLGRRNDVECIIKELDIGVLLSKKGHAEGISNAIMEYMAAGKPVIATDTGGNPELVIDGETGFLIPHEDADELISKIKILLENPDKRKEMGSMGMQKIKDSFSLDSMVEQFIAIFRDASGAKRRPSHES